LFWDGPPVLQISMTDMSPLLTELLGNGKTVCLTVTGNSMYPFLRGHIDCVYLEKADPERLRAGDIVLVRKPGGQYVLHRVIKPRGNTFCLLGDAQTVPEGPFGTDCVVAAVRGVKRRDRYIDTSNLCWRVLSWIWLFLGPLRPFLISLRRALSGGRKGPGGPKRRFQGIRRGKPFVRIRRDVSR
jgi:signal peptidase